MSSKSRKANDSRKRRRQPKYKTEVKRMYSEYREKAKAAGVTPWGMRVWAQIELSKYGASEKGKILRRFLTA